MHKDEMSAPKCRECGGPLPIRKITAMPGKHPDPGDYCSSNCVINAFLRGRAYYAELYWEEFDELS